MKPEIKKKWIAALRSGQYKQCTGRLTDGRGFCCLGVLTNLYAIEKGLMWEREVFGGPIGLPENGGVIAAGTLPDAVRKWAGLKTNNPMFGESLASEWNDAMGAKFPQIADLIEEHL